MATVTNVARSSRGVATLAGATVILAPGQSADIALADHPVHDAWVAAGELEIEAAAVELEPELPVVEPEQFGPPPPPDTPTTKPRLYGPPPPPDTTTEPTNERKRRTRNAS